MTAGAKKGKAAIIGRVNARPARVRVSTARYTDNGGRIVESQSVKVGSSEKHRAAAEKEMQEQYEALSADRRRAFNEVRDIADPTQMGESWDGWDDAGGDELWDLEDALNGDGMMESGAGGEFRDTLEEAIRREQEGTKTKIAKQAEAFQAQMDAITDAYIEWGSKMKGELDKDVPRPELNKVQKDYFITVVDIFRTYTAAVPMRYTDKFTSSALVSQGFFPCAPWNPSLAFSTRLLELFRVAHLRTLQLSIQAWMKTIADLHGAAFKPYRAQQFSIAYDVFSESLENVDARVMHALGRDGPDWRLTNCCSGSMYKLEGEEELEFSMLVTMDGNDSLKRVLRKEAQDFDEDGNLIPGESKERSTHGPPPLGRTTSYPGRRWTFGPRIR
ncbi:hypothetical protein B0H16DRAFT_1448452 [Mycena metata]|uniref:Uncharacterized protein n=1 Tax=Mycena metata TaxID=1033252 RepID=A0AAD7K618_9AGAR|nr:hypothetical protein B0H16DRAFT_1448452 [Mycena metata]